MKFYSIYFLIVGVFLTCAAYGCSESNTSGEVNHPHAEEIAGLGDFEHSILVFSKTSGWRHDSIEYGIEALSELAAEHNIGFVATEELSWFRPDFLEVFSAVVFLNTSETIFEDEQRANFKAYIQNGGGFVGIHSASDTEYDWPWYHGLVGAYFDNHPNDPNVRHAVIDVVNPDHPSTRMLPERWDREDEWYNFRDINDGLNVLLKLDTDSYEGSDHPGNHPIAWYHEYDGGRAFYTALGHTKESFSEDLYLQHLWGGIMYAMGIE